MSSAMQTVFVVDDSQEVRTALSRMLGAGGYLVRSFESAERFLEKDDGDTPGCLLLDICMPGMSGLDMQRALSGSSRARPIVFLTGYGDVPKSVDAMRVGAVDFLTKPIDRTRLFAALDEALRIDDRDRSERLGPGAAAGWPGCPGRDLHGHLQPAARAPRAAARLDQVAVLPRLRVPDQRRLLAPKL